MVITPSVMLAGVDIQCINDATSYKHSSLADVIGEDLKRDLFDMFCDYSENSEKMANLGSTQANEYMNQLIATKAPTPKLNISVDPLP